MPLKKSDIKDALRDIGFPEANHSDADLLGIRNSVVAIAHFPIGGRSFFKVVMASGDSGAGDLTKNTRDEVVNRVRSIQSFD